MRTLQVSVLVLISAIVSVAQDLPTASKPSFEVASVKPNNTGNRGSAWSSQPGGRFIAVNLTLAMIIRNAFDLQEAQLAGLPDWGNSERFDITAKAEKEFVITGERPSLMQRMVQSLLEERFKLVAHRETRDLPAYALVVARADGQLGPQLKPSPIDCIALNAARRAGTATPLPPGTRPPCVMRGGAGKLAAGSIPMNDLAATLSGLAGRQVVDRTGLKGGFDFDFTWSPEQVADASGPSLFTALQEQLGLKLEPQRIPTDVLVVDSIERPTPD